MKILLFGKNGQVGWELQRSLASIGEIIALSHDSSNLCGDLTDLVGIAQTVHKVKPTLIVNAGAYTAVDKAESDSASATTINAIAPGILAQEAAKLGAWLVHYSTDYVFDGSGNVPWKESDATSPLNVYGSTKRDGEIAIQKSGCHHLIFRCSWIYAARGNNFAKTMIRLGKERDRLTVTDDQIGAPTGADLIADVTAHAIRAAMHKPKASGLYNLAAAGATSWYDYAGFVLHHAREHGIDMKLSLDGLIPIKSEAFPTAAKRPHNSRFDTRKLRQTFGLNFPEWQHGVARMLNEILQVSAS